MTRGYPDYFGQSVFMKHGGFRRYSVTFSLTALETEEQTIITGKGVIYAGRIYVNNKPNQKSLSMKITIDDEAGSTYSFKTQLENGGFAGCGDVLFLTYYDIVSGNFDMRFTPGITFDETVKLELRETANEAVNIPMNIHYALIQ